MTRKRLSDEELVEYSREHIFYELVMLFDTGATLQSGKIDTSPRSNNLPNAVLESFAIHVRNVTEFIYPRNKRHGDVSAQDFFASGELPSNFPKITPELDRAWNRANKEVGHLTVDRVIGAPPEKAWPIIPLLQHLLPRLTLFVQQADPKKLASEVRDLMNKLNVAIGISLKSSAQNSLANSTVTVITTKF
jgi:hypothetical protein